jgi:pilus assembly protein CpaE
VADLARNIDRLDADLLQSAMTQVTPGLWVLASPEDPAHAADVTPAHVESLLRVAQTCFDFVVIDAGRSLTAVTLQALDQADRVYPVLQLTLPYIRDGRRLRQVFMSLGYAEDKVQWLVNRYDKKSQITLEDLKRTLQVHNVTTLPNQYEAVAASVNQGVPIHEVAPRSPITRSLRELADRIDPPTSVNGSARPAWLSSLLPGMKRSAAEMRRAS